MVIRSMNKPTPAQLQDTARLLESNYTAKMDGDVVMPRIPTTLANLPMKKAPQFEQRSRTPSPTPVVECDSSMASSSSDDSAAPRLLPVNFYPQGNDVIVRAGGRNINSDSYEVLLHTSIPAYLQSSPRNRGLIVDEILMEVARNGGHFIQFTQGGWATVSEAEARDYTANEIKKAAREILTAIRQQRKEMQQAAVREMPAKRDSLLIKKRALQVKFKRPKRKMAATATAEPQHRPVSPSPLELLSQVASMQ